METKYASSQQQLALALLLLVASAGIIEGSALSGRQSQQQYLQSHQTSAPVSVQTSSGILNGAKQTLNIGTNNSVYKFLSVPYAEAPIGQLRFKRPVELKDRSELVVDASEFGRTCPQYRHLTRFISPLLNIDTNHQTSEDCLHLNIYVPSTVGSVATSESSNKLEPNKQLPVIVWIPGEGFDFADARQFDGSNLAHKTQSIVVTVQYRVGVLGFLHAPSMGVQGNMGIHDQLMALKWIKKNIVAFGGDSERVTLMGRFSGSMSISAIITAPNQELVKQNGEMLFNRVAMLSGIAVEDWIIDSQQAKRVGQLENAALLKKYCTTTSVSEHSCLQNMPVDQLLRIADYGWRLVVDNELIGQHSPIEAIRMNQFASELDAVLIGETGMEGTLCLYRHMLESRNNNYAQLIEEDKMTTNDLYEIIRYDSNAYFGYNLTKSNPIQAALESMIENSADKLAIEQENISSSKLREKYLNACSSYMVKSHSNRLKRNIMTRNQLIDNRMDSRKKPVEVFHYELKYKPTFSLAPDYIRTAAHGDDIPLIFGLIYNQPKREINEADLLMTRKMMAYVGNFVHGNNPLLSQHSSIGGSKQTDLAAAKSLNENETSSMDENESSNGQLQGQDNNQPIMSSSLASLIKRSWSSEGLVHSIEFNENDFDEIQSAASRQSNGNTKVQSFENENAISSPNANKHPARNAGQQHPNIRMIVVESPQPLNNAADLKAQSIFEFVEQQRSNQQTMDEQQHGQHEPISMHQATKSQRLINFGRQQMLSDLNDLWAQYSRRGQMMGVPTFQSQLQQQLLQSSAQSQQQPQPQQQALALVNESSFMTMLVFSACIIIFALMSLCFGLCLVIFRNNLAANKEIQHFNSSTSTCNICEDVAQRNSIDAVLAGGNRKDGRGFSNVFAKLKNHNHHNLSQPQGTSANSIRQQSGSSTNLVLQQRVESEANQRDQ